MLGIWDFVLYLTADGGDLVLKDASRVNVLDYKKVKSVRKDAETLSKFLNVPVWDAS